MDGHTLTRAEMLELAFQLAGTFPSEHARDVLRHNDGSPIVITHEQECSGIAIQRTEKAIARSADVPSLTLATLAVRVDGGFHIFRYEGFIPLAEDS